MWIVKIGGSLATNDALLSWLEVLGTYGSGEAVIVPGGGPFAELVDSSQNFWQFDDASAHHMALLAMAQYGVMMSGMRAGLVPVDSERELRLVLEAGGVPIWLPTDMVRSDHDVQPSWEVTSDSLAAWLAHRLGANQLLLVKSVQLGNRVISADSLMRQGVVDAAFPRYVQGCQFSVWLLAKDQHDQVPQLFAGTATVGTLVFSEMPEANDPRVPVRPRPY